MKFSRSVSLLTVLLLIAGSVSAGELMKPEDSEVSKRGKMLRSALLPGLGQMEQGRIGRGVAWAGGAVVLGVATFFMRSEYHSSALDFENAEGSYQRALADWDIEAARGFLDDRNEAQPRAESNYDARRVSHRSPHHTSPLIPEHPRRTTSSAHISNPPTRAPARSEVWPRGPSNRPTIPSARALLPHPSRTRSESYARSRSPTRCHGRRSS